MLGYPLNSIAAGSRSHVGYRNVAVASSQDDYAALSLLRPSCFRTKSDALKAGLLGPIPCPHKLEKWPQRHKAKQFAKIYLRILVSWWLKCFATKYTNITIKRLRFFRGYARKKRPLRGSKSAVYSVTLNIDFRCQVSGVRTANR